MIGFRQKGDFSKTTKFLTKLKQNVDISAFEKYGKKGVAALASATPVDSGLTANSWYYKIETTNDFSFILQLKYSKWSTNSRNSTVRTWNS